MENECYFCSRPLAKEDRDREVPTEYINDKGDKPCTHCYNHMVEIDFKYNEWE